MILTGTKILEEYNAQNITITPFLEDHINPNSYNYRLGDTLKVFDKIQDSKAIFREVLIPDQGYEIQPGQMYLGTTLETIGSKKYAMSLIGRSSLGRLGLFLQISANLGHTSICHKWTLEIVATQKIILYKGMKIGQISFWCNEGDHLDYIGKYANFSSPQQSLYKQQ